MPKNSNPQKQNEQPPKNLPENIKAAFNDLDLVQLSESFEEILTIRISLLDNNDELLYTTDNTEEVIGYTFDDFKLLAAFGFIHPDDRSEVISTFKNLNEKGISESIIYRIFKFSGEQRWIRGISQQFLDENTGKQAGLLIIEFDVTDQIRKLDIANTQEESFYKSLLELMQTPLLYLMNNNIVWASTKWQKQFEYTLSEAKNQTIEILFKSQDDYADFLLAGSKELKKTGHLLYNIELVTKSKKAIESDMVVYPVDKTNLSKGILIFFIDYSFISEKLSPTNDSLDFYNAVVANSEELILGIKDNMIFSVNQQTETILQYSSDELIGKDLSLLFQTKETYKEFINGVNKKFITNSNYTDEITINRHDRFPLIFSARASPVSYQEKKGFILILTPLNELRQLINILRDEKGELEFYSDQLFHDVKNLCQSAYSQIDISMMRLDDDPTDSYERQRRSLTTISRIAELITNMDKFFKIRRKGYELQPYDISTAIENAKEKIKQKFELRKIDIKHNLKAQKFLTLGNELLEDVFLNILENSLMYDRRREVEINIRAKDSFEHDDYWRIEFIFTNPNVSREMRKFIDVGYVRDSRTISGSGFGLTLVKAIVESMNGYLTIQDDLLGNKEQGSLIVFETPKYFP